MGIHEAIAKVDRERPAQVIATLLEYLRRSNAAHASGLTIVVIGDTESGSKPAGSATPNRIELSINLAAKDLLSFSRARIPITQNLVRSSSTRRQARSSMRRHMYARSESTTTSRTPGRPARSTEDCIWAERAARELCMLIGLRTW
jgi:hypothetical protein